MRSRSTEPETLLPTPNASVANDGEGTETWLARRERVKLTAGNGNGMGMPLAIAVQLLPVYALGGERQDDERTQGQVVLEEVADWGKYREAVERTELVSGIPAPAPAIPDGKGGKMRLHDRFVEWMMLLLPGWVTGHGLTRQKALERLGNGVVPLQAAAATATNLTRLAEYKRAVESLGVAA